MDTITHAAMGAVIGQAGFSHKLGRRAMAWGALIATVPDIDVFVILSKNPFAEVLYHRGITHSLLFAALIGPLFGYVIWRYYSQKDTLSSWISLSFWALITHPLLDLFTVYGTQLLAPWSDHRFAFSAIPIVDPIYTGILLLGLLIGIIFHSWVSLSRITASFALLLTSSYLFYGIAQNDLAYDYAKQQLKEEGHPNADVRVYTTMFQIFMRRVVVHFPEEAWVGFLTTYAPEKIIWNKQIQAPEAIRTLILNHPYGKIYRWFTNDELIFRPHPSDPSKWDMIDARFGFKGPTVWGIWGRTVSLDQNGRVENDFTNFRVPMKVTLSEILDLWKAAFGRTDL